MILNSIRCLCSAASTCALLLRKWDNVRELKFAVYALKPVWWFYTAFLVLTSTGMYALRERRQHVTQEDFEFAIAKASVVSRDMDALIIFGQVLKKNQEGNTSVNKLFS